MTTQCEHTYQLVNDLQSVCVRCDHIVTIGYGRCYVCGAPLDDHVGVIPGPASGACVTIKRVSREGGHGAD